MSWASEQPGGFVLHADCNAFFVQVHQIQQPALQGMAIAIQQHQDIIAANAAAKAAGVRKHMSPAEARRLLGAVGGRVVHVHTEPGGRVSYVPYKKLSARLMAFLKTLPYVSVCEKASIDEAFLLLQPGPGDASVSPEAAQQRAQDVKAAVQRELGLAVSVGAAPNRLMAKLASTAAKPDGVYLVPDQQAALALLAQTPASRLPGYGGKAAEAFERHGISTATDLQRLTQQQMEQQLGLRPAQAAQLAEWCRGLDSTPVQERGPPKQVSVSMSLTPQLIKAHPAQGMPVAGGRAGVLEPLTTGKPDFRPRVRQLMEAMGLDLLQRVQEDAEEEARWPRTLSASMRAFGAGKDQAFTTRSSAFPSRALAGQQQAAPAAAQQQQQQQQQQRQQLGALEEAVVRTLEQLLHQVAATYPPTATVVELRLTATNFQAAAAAGAPITRFFAPLEKHAERELQHAEQRQQERHGEEQQHQQQQQQQEQHQQQHQQQQHQQRAPADPDSVDLGSIDVQEQRYIMAQLEQQQQARQQAGGQRKAAGSGKAKGGGSGKRKAAGDDAKQSKICAFLKK